MQTSQIRSQTPTIDDKNDANDAQLQCLINNLKRAQLRRKQEIESNRERHSRNMSPNTLKHRTMKQREKDGELDSTINVNNIKLLFLENGVKEFNGKFWTEYENAVSSMYAYRLILPAVYALTNPTATVH